MSVERQAPRGALPEGLVAELRERLQRAVARACPGWFAGHREDIVQNALMNLVRRLEKNGRNRDLSSMYLMKAAHGAAVDEIRRWCRGEPMLAVEGTSLERRPSRAVDPERGSLSVEIARAIRACLARLLRPRRLAVTLHLQGCTAPETSRRLGWSLGKTEKLVYRGLGDLRRCLRAKGIEP